MKLISTLWIVSFVSCLLFSSVVFAEEMHGAALYGKLKYPANFKAFEYVNPDAPKGGNLVEASFSAFDTLNPFVITGVAPDGIGLTHDTLMKQSADEAFSLYGLIADKIDISENRSSVRFHINTQAKFSDGSPITAEDVLFSFNMLREKGVPMYRAYYQDVKKATVINPQTILFELSAKSNRELPLILGELPVLSKAYWKDKDFTKTTFEVPVSSGPYLIDKVIPNRSITYRRNPNYWAKDLNTNKGMYNFDTIRFDVYRDTTVAVEAFKAGLLDIRLENEAKKWHVLSDDPLVKKNRVIAKAFPHHQPSGMQGFVFNLRRPLFQDVRVRQALALVFDYKWTNHSLFYDAYTRTESYFDNSFLKATGLPSQAEQNLLKNYPGKFPNFILTVEPPYLKPYAKKRDNLSAGLELLEQAGWRVDKRGVLRNGRGQPFQFEILIDSASGPVWERVILPYIDRLKRLGIEASVRTVDTFQYKNRLDEYDYDMIVTVWGQSLSPGNEQRYFWGSEAAEQPGSWNYSGVKNDAIDGLIEKIIEAKSEEDHLAAVHALDRVLLSLYLVVPHWYLPETRYLYWNKFGIPEKTPMKGTSILWWWDKNSGITKKSRHK